jgi:hypothetical protein
VLASVFGRDKSASKESSSMSSTVSYTLLRSTAEETSQSCQKYFDSITNFAKSNASGPATEQLRISLVNLTDVLIRVNGSFGYLAKNMSTSNASLQMVKTIQNLEGTEEDAATFLRTTVKSECNKWKRISTLTTEMLQTYIERDFQVVIQKTATTLCDSARAELQLVDTKKLYDILQCAAEESEGNLFFYIVLSDLFKSDWVKNLNLDSAPDAQEMNKWLFDIPLQTISSAFRESGIDPVNFDSIVIVFKDEKSTIYDIGPEDFTLALQASTPLETVSILRDKMVITDS